jgi:hypothetical protein
VAIWFAPRGGGSAVAARDFAPHLVGDHAPCGSGGRLSTLTGAVRVAACTVVCDWAIWLILARDL